MDRQLSLLTVGAVCVSTLCLSPILARGEPPQPFPLPPGQAAPSVDAAMQRRVRLELDAVRAETFYRGHFERVVNVEVSGGAPEALVVRSRRPDDGWRRAVVSPAGRGTLITLTPHYRLVGDVVPGSPPMWVHMVIPRSTETRLMLEQDHLRRPRRPGP